jgi:hypothetical protein
MAASYTGFWPHERDSGGFVHSFKLGIKCRKVNCVHQTSPHAPKNSYKFIPMPKGVNFVTDAELIVRYWPVSVLSSFSKRMQQTLR